MLSAGEFFVFPLLLGETGEDEHSALRTRNGSSPNSAGLDHRLAKLGGLGWDVK